MKKLILAGVAAATLFTAGVVTTQPASARCWFVGPFRHCTWGGGPYHHYWGGGYYRHPWY